MKKDKIMGTYKWLFWVSIGTVLIIIYKFFDNFSGIGDWISNLFSILAPFILAILISYVLYKPCEKIEKKLKKKTKHARKISIFIVYVVLIVLILLILNFVIPAIISSIIDLINNIQVYYNSIRTNEYTGNIEPFIEENLLNPMVNYIGQIDIKAMITPERVLSYISSAIGVVKTIISGFIAIVCSIYILSERESIVSYINKLSKAIMSKEGYSKFNRYFSNGNKIFFNFISSQFIDAIVVSILMSTLLIILKVKYAILLGVMIGVFNLIPYFGAIVAVIISTLLTILTGGWQQALIMLIFMTILQQVDANIINPKITGDKLSVSPLLIIFAVTIGGAYFGILGMFIAVPIAVLIKLMINDFIVNKNSESEPIKKEYSFFDKEY